MRKRIPLSRINGKNRGKLACKGGTHCRKLSRATRHEIITRKLKWKTVHQPRTATSSNMYAIRYGNLWKRYRNELYTPYM